MSKFELASRQKLRFATSRGSLSTEDLWDLKLTELNDLAKGLNQQLKASTEEDFLKEKSTADKGIQLRFDLVLHVLQTKQAEADLRKNTAAVNAEVSRLAEILGRKENAELENLSADELRAKIVELQKGAIPAAN
jgi:hypothetical protein